MKKDKKRDQDDGPGGSPIVSSDPSVGIGELGLVGANYGETMVASASSIVSVPLDKGMEVQKTMRSLPKAIQPVSMIPNGPSLPDDLAQFVASNWVQAMESLMEVGAWPGSIPRSFKVKVGLDGSLLLKAVILPKDVVVVKDVRSRGIMGGVGKSRFNEDVPQQEDYENEGCIELGEEEIDDGVDRRTLVLRDDGEVEVFRK